MSKTINNDILEKLRLAGDSTYHQVYKQCYPSVEKYIVQNSGSKQDAEDVFQEAMLILLEKSRQPQFELSSSLKTFLFSISKNIWLKKLRDAKKMPVADNLDKYEETLRYQENSELNTIELLPIWLQKITENCKRILHAIFFINEPMESLMVKMGWKNKHTASNQKYKCIEQIRKEAKK